MKRSTFRPRDLLNQDIAGICGVARMTDKARAAYNGKIGSYYRYGADSKQDTEILSFLEMSAEDFQNAAVQIENDLKLAAWILENINKTSEEVSEFNSKLKSFVEQQQQIPNNTYAKRRRQLTGDNEPPFPWWVSPEWWAFWKIFNR